MINSLKVWDEQRCLICHLWQSTWGPLCDTAAAYGKAALAGRSHSVSRPVCSCLLQTCRRAHASASHGNKHLYGPRYRLFQRVCAKGRSPLGHSSKIRTRSITNTGWWMNWLGRHVCVRMASYYRSNRTKRWSWLKVTLISFCISIIGSALVVMAGSTISIPVLLFGEHDRAALLWLTRWRITLLFRSSVYCSPFLLANRHPCIYNCAKIFKRHSMIKSNVCDLMQSKLVH